MSFVSRIVNGLLVLVFVWGGWVLLVSGFGLMIYDVSVGGGGYEYEVVEVGSDVEGDYIPYSSLDDGEKEVVDDVISNRGGVELNSSDGVPVDDGEHTVVKNGSGYVLELSEGSGENEYEFEVAVLLFSGFLIMFFYLISRE